MKPSNILYCLLAVCLLSGFPARGQTQPIRSEYYYSFPQLGTHYETDTATMEEFVYYTVGDLDLTSQPGAPTLPVQYVRFSVPYNAADITVSATRSSTSLYRYGLRVYPVPQPIPTDGSVTGGLPMVIDSAIYNTDAYWPASVAEMVSDGFYLGDNRVITVAMYPIQYNPKKTFLRFNTEIELTISYTIGATPGNILVRQDATLRQQERNQVKTLVENPDSVEPFSTERAIPAHLLPVQNDAEPRVGYLIITPDSLSSAFKRLVAFKRQKGYTVEIKTVEQILSDTVLNNGDVTYDNNQNLISVINDAPGKIRQFLKQYFQNRSLMYVLFAGKDVPFRYGTYHNLNTGEITTIPTDIYYSNLTSAWDCNSNGVYGEDEDLLGDPLAPTIFVGRIPFETKNEVEIYSSKLLTYELNPGYGNSNYLTNSLYMNHLEMQNFNFGDSLNSLLSNTFNGEILNADINTPTGSYVVNKLNQTPYGFISINNHGTPVGVNLNNSITHIYNLWALENEKLTSNIYNVETEPNSIDMWDNPGFPCVVYSISCTTMPFDIYTTKSNYTYDVSKNFGEVMILGAKGRAVAYLGNTRDGVMASSFNMQKLFLRIIMNTNPKLSIAEGLSKIKGMTRNIKFTHNLFGDPEIELWTATPSHYSSYQISRTNNSVTISGFSDADTSVVALSNGSYQTWLQPSNGNVIFNDVNPNSTIMLYRHNYLPWIAPLVLQNERVTDDRYIIASDVTAGRSVDANRTSGDFVIATGTTYEIEHKGTVSLQPGFKVEKGSTFSVKPSDY